MISHRASSTSINFDDERIQAKFQATTALRSPQSAALEAPRSHDDCIKCLLLKNPQRAKSIVRPVLSLPTLLHFASVSNIGYSQYKEAVYDNLFNGIVYGEGVETRRYSPNS